MTKKNLFKPVTRTTPSGVKITFTSRKELEAFDNDLRRMVEEKRKKSADSSPYAKEVAFEPDFSV